MASNEYIQLKQILLLGGPLTHRRVKVPAGMEQFSLGRWWTYRYAGKLKGEECFAIVPRKRREQRYELWYILKHAAHPRVQALEEAHENA